MATPTKGNKVSDLGEASGAKSPAEEPGCPYPSISMIRLGGRTIAMVTSSRCGVCASPGRWVLEMTVVLGMSYRATAAAFSLFDVSPDTLRRHFVNGHVPGYGPLGAQEISPAMADVAVFSWIPPKNLS